MEKELNYEQLLELARQLPKDKLAELKAELDKLIIENESRKTSSYRGILKGIDIKDFEEHIKRNREE